MDTARRDDASSTRARVADGHRGDLQLLVRLLRHARPYWPQIAGVFVLGLLATPLALLAPVPLKIVVDNVIGGQPVPPAITAILPEGGSQTEILLLAAGLLIAIALATQVQELAAELLRTWTGERLVLDLRAQLFRHVQRLSFAWSDARGTADSVYRIQYDAPAIQYVSVDGILPFLTATVTIVGMIYVAARIDPTLALVALGITPCLFIAIGAMRRRLRRGSRDVKRLETGALAIAQEVLSAIRVVKAFGQEDRERDRYVDQSRTSLRAKLRLVATEGAFGILIGLITAAGMAATLVVGVIHVGAGLITLGDLLLVLGYLAQLYSPLTTMSRRAARLQAHLASAERAYAVLDELPDVLERPHARGLRRAKGVVVFDRVTFGYPGSREILRDITLMVHAGTRVGIKGTTGAGKTTLVSLLSRFYDPTGGRILLDGIDLRHYRLTDLRSQFAIVLQDPVLFSTTVAENIGYGRPGASQARLRAAAEAAGAAGFIERLPDGYSTLVGERGMRLSGGERQRIALARAFLKDAPILILDEPTSAVDSRTEGAILEAIERLMRGRTTFVIAHRASTLKLCDVVFRLERNRMAPVAPCRGRTAPSRGRTGARIAIQ
jgi:ATP-binding cassette subfamily B protein